jgi:hypothetical protein
VTSTHHAQHRRVLGTPVIARDRVIAVIGKATAGPKPWAANHKNRVIARDRVIAVIGKATADKRKIPPPTARRGLKTFPASRERVGMTLLQLTEGITRKVSTAIN